jgi:hypothetical protein
LGWPTPHYAFFRQLAVTNATSSLNPTGLEPRTFHATALIACFIFREVFDRRIALGMRRLVAGALILSWSRQARRLRDNYEFHARRQSD